MPYTEATLKQLVWQRRIFLAVNVASAFALGVLFFFISNQNQKIQDERAASIHRACVDQNLRHAHTIKVLNQQIALLPPDRRAQAEESKAFTILLINALVPIRDCDKAVELAVPSK